MRWLGIIGLWLAGSSIALSQIVNIESLRTQQDSVGWSGREVFAFKVTKNTARLLELNNNLALQYRQPQHLILFLSHLNFTLGENTDFERNGFFHLRYNHIRNTWLSYEYFNQYQIDLPLRIEERVLTGAGPRFTLLQKGKNSLVAGTLVMYEYDKELGTGIIHRDFRGSAYLSASVAHSKFDLTALLYYQPRLDRWIDFRTSAQIQLLVRVWKNFALTSTGALNYDVFPVQDASIPELTYKIANGLVYTF